MANEFKVKNGIKFPDGTVQTTASSGVGGSSSTSLEYIGIIAPLSTISGELNKHYLLDTRDASLTITLPTAPTSGQEIVITDWFGSFAVNPVTVNTSDLYFYEDTDLDSLTLDSAFHQYTFVRIGDSWQVHKQLNTMVGAQSVTPIIYTSTTSEYESVTVTLYITNYIEYAGSYSVSVTGGTVTRQADTIQWTLPAVSTNTNYTLTVGYTVTGVTSTAEKVITVLAVPSNVDTAVVWDLSTNSYNDGWI